MKEPRFHNTPFCRSFAAAGVAINLPYSPAKALGSVLLLTPPFFTKSLFDLAPFIARNYS